MVHYISISLRLSVKFITWSFFLNISKNMSFIKYTKELIIIIVRDLYFQTIYIGWIMNLHFIDHELIIFWISFGINIKIKKSAESTEMIPPDQNLFPQGCRALDQIHGIHGSEREREICWLFWIDLFEIFAWFFHILAR